MTAGRPQRIALSATAARTITQEAPTSRDGNETGGILLGSSDEHIAYVRHAGRPGPCAIRRPQYFSRDLEYAQKLADQTFDADQSVWIGEWHTHLAAPPTPSHRDLVTYLRLLADPELAFDHIVAVIATTSDNWLTVQLAGWLVRPGQSALVPIVLDTLS